MLSSQIPKTSIWLVRKAVGLTGFPGLFRTQCSVMKGDLSMRHLAPNRAESQAREKHRQQHQPFADADDRRGGKAQPVFGQLFGHGRVSGFVLANPECSKDVHTAIRVKPLFTYAGSNVRPS